MVERVANDLAGDGTIERGWLGVNIQSTRRGPRRLVRLPRGATASSSPAWSTERRRIEAGLRARRHHPRDRRSEDRHPATPGPHDREVERGRRRDRIHPRRRADQRRPPRSEADRTRGIRMRCRLGRRRTPPREAPVSSSRRSTTTSEEAGLESDIGVFVRGVEPTVRSARPGSNRATPSSGSARTSARRRGLREALDEIPEDQPIRMLVETIRHDEVRPDQAESVTSRVDLKIRPSVHLGGADKGPRRSAPPSWFHFAEWEFPDRRIHRSWNVCSDGPPRPPDRPMASTTTISTRSHRRLRDSVAFGIGWSSDRICSTVGFDVLGEVFDTTRTIGFGRRGGRRTRGRRRRSRLSDRSPPRFPPRDARDPRDDDRSRRGGAEERSRGGRPDPVR